MKTLTEPNPTPPLQPVQEPAAPQPQAFTSQPQSVTCPFCHTLVFAEARFCPQCGNALPPPPTFPIFPPAPTPKKPRTRLIVGIVLIVLLVGGVAVYAVYQLNQNNQPQVSQAAKNSEQTAASQAPSQIQFTCFNVTTTNTLQGSPGNYYSGYLAINEKFGLSNPTRFIIDATWTIRLDYTLVALLLSDTALFHMASNGVAHPVFVFKMTAAQANSLAGHTQAQLQTFTVALDGSYTVTGTYGTYHPTQHLNYDSTTNAGTGSLGSNGGLPNC